MSTLPFLLSVADELDNNNSQSYMDDFGLGFHPHRQYYRTPTIQLSLPASTDWMQQERGQRYRNHKFYYEMDRNFQTASEEDKEEELAHKAETDEYSLAANRYNNEPSTSAACSGRQNFVTASESKELDLPDNVTLYERAIAASSIKPNSNKKKNAKSFGGATAMGYDDEEDDDDNIDNSVRMYNLSKKCCKNYHRHAMEANAKDSCTGSGADGRSSGGTTGSSGYKLHSKCMEGNISSSDESLQKVSSSIEFLTCFLLKRSRASSSSSKNTTSCKKS